MEMWTCTKCGKLNDADVRRCYFCGHFLNESTSYTAERQAGMTTSNNGATGKSVQENVETFDGLPDTRMKKTTKLRLVGGFVLLFNLWLIGKYGLKGILVLLLTLGFAAAYEYLIVRKQATYRSSPISSFFKDRINIVFLALCLADFLFNMLFFYNVDYAGYSNKAIVANISYKIGSFLGTAVIPLVFCVLYNTRRDLERKRASRRYFVGSMIVCGLLLFGTFYSEQSNVSVNKGKAGIQLDIEDPFAKHSDEELEAIAEGK